MISKIFVLMGLLGCAFSQMIVSPFNGTFHESGGNVQTIISGLKDGDQYRLAFYPTDTGRILWSMNFTAIGACPEFYYAHIPLKFDGNGTIQLYSYADDSVPSFVSINVIPHQGSHRATSRKSKKQA